MPSTKGAPKAKADKKVCKQRKDEEHNDTDANDKVKIRHNEAGIKDSLGNDDTDYCVDCGRGVLSSQEGMKCDGCGFWHHAQCQKVSDDIYSFLCSHNDEPSLMWYCNKCVSTCKKMTAMMLAMQDHNEQLERKLSELENSMHKKIENLAKKIDEKDSQTHVKVEETMDKAHKRVEEKVDKLVETVNKKQTLDSHLVHDYVEDAVLIKLEEDREEAEEIKRRANNVIIHGLREPPCDSVDADTEDESQIINMLHAIKCDEVSVTNAVRLGKKKEQRDGQPAESRPMKLTLSTIEQKEKLIRQAKNLMSNKDLEKVFIQPDLTPKQRKKRQELVQELKRRKAAGEKDLIIVNNKLVTRRQLNSTLL